MNFYNKNDFGVESMVKPSTASINDIDEINDQEDLLITETDITETLKSESANDCQTHSVLQLDGGESTAAILDPKEKDVDLMTSILKSIGVADVDSNLLRSMARALTKYLAE